MNVKCPKAFEPLFQGAQEYVDTYFKNKDFDPVRGTISIRDERYILVRAGSLSVEFFEFIKGMYPALDEAESIQATGKILFDMAFSIGKADAKRFHKITGVSDPIEKLATGPIHFAFTGWAFVDIFEESKPSTDENYYLIYDHPYSFESHSWIKYRDKTDFCTCFMNAGYSSGWCSESFSVELVSKEILCCSKGDKCCRFIMAHQSRIDEYIGKYRDQHSDLFK